MLYHPSPRCRAERSDDTAFPLRSDDAEPTAWGCTAPIYGKAFLCGLLLLQARIMDALLRLLRENAALKTGQLASLLGSTEADIAARIKAFEEDRVILGYRTVLNEEKLGMDIVRALIEVRITPERGGGFDRLADRIARHSEVQSCYLMSGSYDLLVVVEGNSLKAVASFVSQKLATLQGVLSTATHFMLKPYKEQGVLMHETRLDERLPVSP